MTMLYQEMVEDFDRPPPKRVKPKPAPPTPVRPSPPAPDPGAIDLPGSQPPPPRFTTKRTGGYVRPRPTPPPAPVPVDRGMADAEIVVADVGPVRPSPRPTPPPVSAVTQAIDDIGVAASAPPPVERTGSGGTFEEIERTASQTFVAPTVARATVPPAAAAAPVAAVARPTVRPRQPGFRDRVQSALTTSLQASLPAGAAVLITPKGREALAESTDAAARGIDWFAERTPETVGYHPKHLASGLTILQDTLAEGVARVPGSGVLGIEDRNVVTETYNPDEFTGPKRTAGQVIAQDLPGLVIPGVDVATRWDEMTPAQRAAGVGAEALGLVPVGGLVAKAVRAGIPYDVALRSAAGAYVAGPVHTVLNPAEAAKGVYRGADTALNPYKVPLSAIEATRSTPRLPVASFVGAQGTEIPGLARPGGGLYDPAAAGAAKTAAHELTMQRIHGVANPEFTVGGFTAASAPSPVQLTTGPAIFSTGPDVRGWMQPGGSAGHVTKEGIDFFEAGYLSRFDAGSALGIPIDVGALPGGVWIRDPNIIADVVPTDKTFAPRGPRTEQGEFEVGRKQPATYGEVTKVVHTYSDPARDVTGKNVGRLRYLPVIDNPANPLNVIDLYRLKGRAVLEDVRRLNPFFQYTRVARTGAEAGDAARQALDDVAGRAAPADAATAAVRQADGLVEAGDAARQGLDDFSGSSLIDDIPVARRRDLELERLLENAQREAAQSAGLFQLSGRLTTRVNGRTPPPAAADTPTRTTPRVTPRSAPDIARAMFEDFDPTIGRTPRRQDRGRAEDMRGFAADVGPRRQPRPPEDEPRQLDWRRDDPEPPPERGLRGDDREPYYPDFRIPEEGRPPPTGGRNGGGIPEERWIYTRPGTPPPRRPPWYPELDVGDPPPRPPRNGDPPRPPWYPELEIDPPPPRPPRNGDPPRPPWYPELEIDPPPRRPPDNGDPPRPPWYPELEIDPPPPRPPRNGDPPRPPWYPELEIDPPPPRPPRNGDPPRPPWYPPLRIGDPPPRPPPGRPPRLPAFQPRAPAQRPVPAPTQVRDRRTPTATRYIPLRRRRRPGPPIRVPGDRPRPQEEPRRRPPLYPRIVSWSQGFARHTVDLLTGAHEVRRAPPSQVRVEGTTRRRAPRRVDTGVVDTVITARGPRHFLDDDAEVLASGEIVRRRPRRQRGVL